MIQLVGVGSGTKEALRSNEECDIVEAEGGG